MLEPDELFLADVEQRAALLSLKSSSIS